MDKNISGFDNFIENLNINAPNIINATQYALNDVLPIAIKEMQEDCILIPNDYGNCILLPKIKSRCLTENLKAEIYFDFKDNYLTQEWGTSVNG